MRYSSSLAACIAVGSFVVVSAQAQSPYPVEPSINEELAAHTLHFEKKVYQIGERVYSAVGWGLANTIMVVGDDGVVIVDPGVAMESATLVAAELKKISNKPVRAVVYTHFHPDHWGGVKAYATPEDIAADRVKIVAHETLLGNVVRQGGLVGPIQAMRSGYTFGAFLSAEDTAGMNGGIGPAEGGGTATFIQPTDTFDKSLDISIAGVEMQFIHVPSEAPDEIAIFLPQDNILLSAETIQGPTLPNIHTLRGTKFRDPVAWVRSIDRLRDFKAANMVPSHGQPVMGAEKVEEVLRMTRDGVQFVHDQTIRYMNKGLTPDELAVAIKFPPHLRDYAPYLREYYGTLPHSVRQIYTGYLGWFNGDPVNLAPTPPNRLAQNHIDLMGGRDAVFSAAEIAYSQDDFQWAAELTTYIIRVDHSDEPARQLKAACLRQLGYASMNINWRNWYLTSAQELEGNINALQALGAMSQNFSSPDVIAAWPASVLVGGLPPRLKAEDTLDRHLTVGFEFTDTQDAYAIEIRNGVAQFHETMPAATDAKLSLTKQVFLRIGAGRLSLADAIANGELAATGDVALVEQFFASFEPLAQEINLTVR